MAKLDERAFGIESEIAFRVVALREFALLHPIRSQGHRLTHAADFVAVPMARRLHVVVRDHRFQVKPLVAATARVVTLICNAQSS